MVFIKKFIISFVISIAVLMTVILINGWHIEIASAQPNNQTVEFGTEFSTEEPIAHLKGKLYFKSGFKIPVTKHDNINKNKIGKYETTYMSHFLWLEESITNTIHIVDTKPPEIILKNIEGHFTKPNEKYQEEGFTAYDNYDGDISKNVISREEDGKIYYIARDSSGNTTTITRTIVYNDKTPPTLTLFGDKEITIQQGENFVEPGYKATDDCDGDITSWVNIRNKVDINKPGTYTIEYVVKDSYKNLASDIRTVIVKEIPKVEEPEIPEEPDKPGPPADEPEVPAEPEPPKKTIYLTFDDGPSKYTSDLLDILNKYNVKATFFVVNSYYNDILPRIVEEGHALAIHSYTHDYGNIYSSVDNYFADLEKIQNLIYDKTGVITNLVRFPGGSSNTVSKKYMTGIMTTLTKEVEARGFKYFDWNVSSGDAGEVTTSDAVFNNVTSGIEKCKVPIVLQHDTKKFSVEAVERIILWAQEKGYTFDVLSMDGPTSHHKVNN